VAGVAFEKLLGCSDHRSKPALHIGGAAPEQQAVANGWHKGIARPLFEGPGRHHVGVAGETERRGLPAPTRPEVADRPEGHSFDREAGSGQSASDEFLAAAVIRADGRARYQGLREL
jgi:hypothetical protein